MGGGGVKRHPRQYKTPSLVCWKSVVIASRPSAYRMGRPPLLLLSSPLLLLLMGSAAAVPPVRTPSSPEPLFPDVPPPVGPTAIQPPPLPPGNTSPAGPIPEPSPPGIASPAGPIPEPNPPGPSRQKRAAGSARLVSASKKASADKKRELSDRETNSITGELSLPEGDVFPHDVELLPGFTAPPGFRAPTDSDSAADSPETEEVPPTPTEAGVPPPAELPEGTEGGNSSEHLNYEGLYYTIYAENNTHQEVRQFSNILHNVLRRCIR